MSAPPSAATALAQTRAALAAGRIDEARRLLEQAARGNPRDPHLWLKLARLTEEHLGKPAAAEFYAKAAAAFPASLAAATGLAECRLAASRPGSETDSFDQLRQAGAANGELRHYLATLAVAASRADHLPEALALCEVGALLDPGNADLQHNCGQLLLALDRLEEAEARHRRGLALAPDTPHGINELANTLHRLGRLDEAAALYRRAVALAPGTRVYRVNLALTLLLMGRMTEGFAAYEARWQGIPGVPAYLRDKAWDGRPAPHATLLLQAEQGFGDTIQFGRFIRQARARVGRVVVACQPELVRLMAGVEGVDQACPETGPLPEFDTAATLLSLPRLLGIEDRLGWDGPYLALAAAPLPDRRIGLCWAGRPGHPNDRARSCPAAALAPLLALPGLSWVSLQKWAPMERFGTLPADRLAPLPDTIADFADTARLVAGLDLVITVDTAVAHLAAALGRPTWLMLPPVPDWRWGMTGETTPWYPAMRLFRRRYGQDWAALVAEIAAALAKEFPASPRNT